MDNNQLEIIHIGDVKSLTRGSEKKIQDDHYSGYNDTSTEDDEQQNRPSSSWLAKQND